ncbi:Hypothetical protein NATL1_16741 [Prochlorococcus marinus str. NATL1A]|uniref:Uncharacterized protein n=1 Tax=Prochlorococcus marinus (strain NATL1A) TaxID=167555 RepID=A2C420_PROM1|nr:tetratricopeptide repeat protein [Prochlorococcus marinus]ABM76230.1 Hypothetical protein NATL1_16741 [Prochlorococcus marinus str. NATL1A]
MLSKEKESVGEQEGKKKVTEVKTFPIPFALEEIKENITLNTKTKSQLPKEQIINQAFKFHSQGNISKATKYYQICIKQGFNNPQVFSNFGILLKEIDQLKEAEKMIKQAIKLKPDYAIAYNNLGNILIDLGRLKEAEIYTKKAIDLKPDYANAYNTLGNILKELDNLKDAEICFSKAISLEPDHESAIINRGQLYFDKGEFKKALKDSDLCNTKQSRAFSLEILYSLGSINEIYNRIEKTYAFDDKNLRLAAFSSFISERENKYTHHNFCPKPLKFLHFNNLKNQLNNYEEFIKGLLKELSEIKTVWEPPKKTTHNGFQTPSYINLFSESSIKISKLKAIICNELDSYYLKFKRESCSYIKKWPSHKKLLGWHVILKKQGYQEAHIHPAGWLSGVIYLKVVPSLGKDEGGIEFSLNGPNYSNINSPQLIHQPEVGDMVFFPSSLHHRTIPFSTDTDRIVVAFDLMPN